MAKCRSCQADIVWMVTKSGKNIPVNAVASVIALRGPRESETEFDFEVHESHFATCPKANFHRKPR